MNKTVILFLVLAVVALVESVCVHNDIEYQEGKRYLDDCNWCRCMNGVGACTRIGCPAKVCSYNGKMYAVNEQFMDAENCNRCTCTASGQAACTAMACP